MKTHNRSTDMLFVVCVVLTFVRNFADEFAHIIHSKSSSDGQGNYEFQVRTSNGISRWQTGRLQYSGDKPYIYVEGGYSYLDRSQGVNVKRVVSFVADQNGYRPTFREEVLTTPRPQYFPPRFGAGASGG